MKDHFCQRCNCRGGDVFHALIECRAARRVWKLIEFYEDVKQMARQDMLSVLQDLDVKRKKMSWSLLLRCTGLSGTPGIVLCLKGKKKI